MATQVQRRRGTTAQNAAFTGVEGEVTFDTQTHRLITHDGATVGGFKTAMLETLNIFTVQQVIGAGNQIILQANGAATFSPAGGGQVNIDPTLNDTISFEGAGVSVGGGESFLIGGNLTFNNSGGGSIISIDSDGPTTVWSISGTGAASFVTGTFSSGANIGSGTTIDSAGNYVGPLMEIENQLTVDTGTGQEANVEFQVFNTDTASVSFGVLGSGALVLADGIRQTFNPNGTNSGFNVGANAVDPSALVNGDIWYQSTANELRARINGATVALGSGGSSPPFTDTNPLVAGSVDATKLLRFEVDGFTAATTRVLTPQNSDYVIAGTNIANGFSVTQDFTTGTIVANTPWQNLTQTWNNAGVAFTGVSAVATNTASAATSRLFYGEISALGSTPKPGLQLANLTAAAVSAQQVSPSIQLTGQGWKTTATAASQSVEWRIYNLPVQGSANPTSSLFFDVSINGGAFNNLIGFNQGATNALSVIGAISTSGLNLSNAAAINWAGRATLKSSADGIIELFNTAQTGFTRLNFGGVTSSFPAITRSGAGFIFNLADGTGSAAITTGNITMTTASLLSITSGANQRAGNAVLVAGTVTVSNTTVTANTIVMLTRKTSGGTIGTAITYTVSAGASFTITSDSVLDTSTFSYLLIEVP